jgi:hypothetical protein
MREKSMENWWNETDRGKPKFFQETIPVPFFPPHLHTDWPEIEPMPLQ